MKKLSETLGAMAQQVRQVFLLERQFYFTRNHGEKYKVAVSNPAKAWDGGRTDGGSYRKPVWESIVTFAIKNGLDPIRLVKATFALASGIQAPGPSDVMSQSAVQKYHSYSSTDKELVQQTHVVNQRNAVSWFRHFQQTQPTWTTQACWKAVVTYPSLDCGPLFRYCLASQLGETELAAGYFESAAVEYMQRREAYDQVLGANITPELKGYSARLYEEALRPVNTHRRYGYDN